MALVDQFVAYLKKLEEQGETHVFLDEGARQVLNELQSSPKGRARAGAGGGREKPQADAVSADLAGELAAMKQQLSDAPTSKPQRPQPPEEVSFSRSIVIPERVELVEGDVRHQLNELAKRCKSWPQEGGLSSLRDKLVFAGGDPGAKLVFVGDAPGFEEERAGKPFVGPAGQKLQQILKAMGLGFDEVYLTNLVKFRPMIPKQGTNNRKPSEAEMQAFLPIFKAEMAALKPELIVALGETVASALSPGQAGIDELRSQAHEFEGFPLRVSFHPSYLLHHDSDLVAKRKLWEDMLQVMEQLAMPISEKQRGFFQGKR